MLSAERFQELLFDRDKVGTSNTVFHALAYYLSPSEPAVYKFLKAFDELTKNSVEEIEQEFQVYFDLVGENIAELFWQAISDSSEDSLKKSAIILTIKIAEKAKNPALKYVAAHCLFENNLFKEASRMLSHIPGANIDVVSLEGLCFFHLKEYQDALSCFLNVLSIDPEDQLAKKFRCLCLVKLGRSAECKDELASLWKIERSIDLFIVYLASELQTLNPSHELSLKLVKDCLDQASHVAIAMDAKSLDTFLTLTFEQSPDWRPLLLGWIRDQDLHVTHIPVLSKFLADASIGGMNNDSKLIQLALEKIMSPHHLTA